MSAPTYDRVGVGYANFRRADLRIEARIHAALGDARSLVNVGAGSGSYEPVMIAQRPPGAAPALQGVAEALPLGDKSVDAAMGVLTAHHWDDLDAGLAEMRRVARKRIVLATIDAERNAEIWTLSEYFPEAMALELEVMPSVAALEASMPRATFEVLPMPARCRDEFTSALWDRPERFLDPELLRASSLWHKIPAETVSRGLEALRADLESGAWDQRHGRLRDLPELDIGMRIVREELL